ncbi:MAG: hypothetical protein U0637_09025 [Phycisphaerales bacterium]
MNSVWQRAWRSLSAGGATVAALAVIAFAVVAPFAWRLVRAWWMPAPSAFVTKDDSKDRAQAYAAAFDPYVKQLDGRSLFYEPSAPGAEGEAPAEVVEEGASQESAPSRYDGPAVTAVVLDTVWFNDGQKLKVGGGKAGDLEVLSTNTPWDVRVRWRGTEFTVPFFDRDKVIFKDRAQAPSAATGAGAARPADGTGGEAPPAPPAPHPASTEVAAAPALSSPAPTTPQPPETTKTPTETPR